MFLFGFVLCHSFVCQTILEIFFLHRFSKILFDKVAFSIIYLIIEVDLDTIFKLHFIFIVFWVIRLWSFIVFMVLVVNYLKMSIFFVLFYTNILIYLKSFNHVTFKNCMYGCVYSFQNENDFTLVMYYWITKSVLWVILQNIS